MDTRIEKFTKAFFWTGYAVFLSASIPHIAAYFRHFDPITSNRWEDVSYWVIATAIAVVIDVSDVLVSIAVMRAKASGAKGRDTFGYWVFIVFITALSWFFNWQYNVVFGTSQFHAVDQYSLFGKATIGQINPVLGSAFQVLLLVYTMMAHKFAQRPKTAAELLAEAERLEALEEAQKRIDAYRDRNKKASIIQRAKETLIEAKEAVIEVRSSSPETSLEADEEEVIGNNLEDGLEDDLEADEFPEEETDPQRTTIKIVSLAEAKQETDRNTDELIVRNRKPSQSGNDSGNNTEASKRIRGILKRKPYITVSELATKANVSKGYASKKKADFLKEHKTGQEA